MARHSSNFGNILQMIVGISREYVFTSNFDIRRPFTQRKTELPRKTATSHSDCRTASCIPKLKKSNELNLGKRLQKNVSLFRPKLLDSLSTNQIARFDKEHCCRSFNYSDAIDYNLTSCSQVVEDFSGSFWS